MSGPLGEITLVPVLMREHVYPRLEQRVPLVAHQRLGRHQDRLPLPDVVLVNKLNGLADGTFLDRFDLHCDNVKELVRTALVLYLLRLRDVCHSNVDVVLGVFGRHVRAQGVPDWDLRSVGVVVS